MRILSDVNSFVWMLRVNIVCCVLKLRRWLGNIHQTLFIKPKMETNGFLSITSSSVHLLTVICHRYAEREQEHHENMFSHLAYCSCPGCCVFIKSSPGGVTVYPWRSCIAAVEEGIDDFPVIWGDFTTIKSVGEFTN